MLAIPLPGAGLLEGVSWRAILLEILILWAVTGYSILHLGVLAWRWLRGAARRLRAPRHASIPAAPPPAQGPQPTIAFVLPVYNEAKTVGPTLESLLAQTRRPDQIVVVDDGSTDGTHRVLKRYRSRGVTLLRMPRNGGKARAIEAGLAKVRTDLVAFTDADSIVHPNYVEEITRSFADPDVVAAAGSVESIPHTWISATRQVEYMVTLHVDRAAQSETRSIFVLPGVSTTYRTHVLRELGFHHDTIGEDLDLTFRLHAQGRRFMMNLAAKVYTSDPPTLKAYARQLHRWYTDIWICARKHRTLFGERWFGKIELPLTLLNSVASSILLLTLPLYLLLFNHTGFLHWLLWTTALDTTLILMAHATYKRPDVWWTLLSRYPTRIISRYTYLKTMTQVLLHRPRMAWNKLERRSTGHALTAVRNAAATR